MKYYNGKGKKKKKYVGIDGETCSNQIFAIMEEIESKAEGDVENLLEGSDTEFIVEEKIKDTK